MKGGHDAHIATGSDGLARAQRARLFCEAVYHVTCTFRQLVQKTRKKPTDILADSLTHAFCGAASYIYSRCIRISSTS